MAPSELSERNLDMAFNKKTHKIINGLALSALLLLSVLCYTLYRDNQLLKPQYNEYSAYFWQDPNAILEGIDIYFDRGEMSDAAYLIEAVADLENDINRLQTVYCTSAKMKLRQSVFKSSNLTFTENDVNAWAINCSQIADGLGHFCDAMQVIVSSGKTPNNDEVVRDYMKNARAQLLLVTSSLNQIDLNTQNDKGQDSVLNNYLLLFKSFGEFSSSLEQALTWNT